MIIDRIIYDKSRKGVDGLAENDGLPYDGLPYDGLPALIDEAVTEATDVVIEKKHLSWETLLTNELTSQLTSELDLLSLSDRSKISATHKSSPPKAFPKAFQAVDSLLARELLKLSPQKRSAIQEEIHGVTCLAIEETPELLEKSLMGLSKALDNDDLFPPHTKKAFLQSQAMDETYVNTDDFRLRFLRFALFDVNKAAEKILRYLDIAQELFGEFALARPVKLSDFSNSDIRYFRKGEIQMLPFRDRSGRRIMTYMNPMERHDNQKAKLLYYMTWVAGNDVDVQRKGLVVLVRFTSAYNLSNRSPMSSENQRISPFWTLGIRPVAVHICASDKPQNRLALALIPLLLENLRIKIKTHFGESMEIDYALESYGIPTNHVPLTFTGSIKDGYAKQWLVMRQYVEDRYSSDNEVDVVECPKPKDVLFRKGRSYMRCQGNERVKQMVQKRYQGESLLETAKRGLSKKKQDEVLRDILLDIASQGGRVLVWNDNGWWNEMSDGGALLTKLERLVKEILKEMRKQERLAKSLNKQVQLECSTSAFQRSDKTISGDCCIGDNNCVSNKRAKLDHWETFMLRAE